VFDTADWYVVFEATAIDIIGAPFEADQPELPFIRNDYATGALELDVGPPAGRSGADHVDHGGNDRIEQPVVNARAEGTDAAMWVTDEVALGHLDHLFTGGLRGLGKPAHPPFQPDAEGAALEAGRERDRYDRW